MRKLRLLVCLAGLAALACSEAFAQEVGSCDTGRASAMLDANNVRAAIYNNGSPFWKGSGNIYTVPKHGDANAIFNAPIWIGGLVDGELRFAGTDYGPFEFYPGPLTESGELPDPSDCSAYDRIYEITLLDLERLDETGEATDDILEWPWELGAPVRDGDGIPDNYDLAGGDRPELTGHQMLWWVMNDVGGRHGWGNTPPLGVEIQSSAFAVLSSDPALNDATFYRYRITNKQSYAIDSTYFGTLVDADLGNAGDDFIGSDTTLGMGYIYNGDNDDDVDRRGYGVAPPALGVDFIRGPVALADGRDNDGDGVVDEPGERTGMSVFTQISHDSSPLGHPFTAYEAYLFMKATWRDGTPQTHGGFGYGGDIPTPFMFPGDPVAGEFWSEVNTDGRGSGNTPSDRNFLMTAGPFRLDPGETEEIVLAIVWARGDDHLDSISELRDADRTVQKAWDESMLQGVPMPQIPTEPPRLVSPAAGVQGQPINPTLRWAAIPYASEYRVEIDTSPTFDGPAYRSLTSITTSVEADSLLPFAEYYWRVRAESPLFETPFSEPNRFETSDVQRSEIGLQTIPGSSNPAFLEVVGPGGVDPCGPDAESTFGCSEAGGNLVYVSFNGTGEYVMYHAGPGPEASLGDFAPNDFEIRFTAQGSYAYHLFGGFEALWVPFEVWDAGPVGFFNENDPADDVQMIPALFSNAGGNCRFDFSEGDDPFGLDWGVSDGIYAYFAVGTYSDWEAVVKPIVEADPNNCPVLDDVDPNAREIIDAKRGRPIQRITFIAPKEADPLALLEGTVIRFYTSPEPADVPILSAPGSGTGPFEQPLTLWWNAQYGSNVRYQVQISAGPAFDDPVFDATTAEESFLVSGLEEGRTYLWRVRLSLPQGPWSEIWTFEAGRVTNVGAEISDEFPKELTLEQNYPNPFNPSTTIRFGLPEAGPVKIQIYDLLGRRVATVVDRMHAAGWHEVTWDAASFASGVYVYSMETRNNRISKSLVVVK